MLSRPMTMRDPIPLYPAAPRVAGRLGAMLVLGALSATVPQTSIAGNGAVSAPNAAVSVPRMTTSAPTIVEDGMPEPLAGAHGDASRGRALVIARNPANCVLCHAVPDPAIRFSGDVGPSLAGVGRRLTASQLRLRVVDSQRLNADTVMPSYYRVDGLVNVAPAYRGKPVLSAGEVEDIVAWLATLQ